MEPAVNVSSREGNSLVGIGMRTLGSRRLELESGAGADHDVPYRFVSPSSMWQWALTGVKNTLAFLLSLSQAWLALLRRELYLLWRFIRYDVPSTIIPGLLFMLASWKIQPQHDAVGLVLAHL